MIVKYMFILICLVLTACSSNKQQALIKKHEITVQKDLPIIDDGFYQKGSNQTPSGEALDINNYYVTKNGKPILMVTGEFQYNRYPKAEWEEGILKMKASGINAIGFYTLWIYHEEIEGSIDFSDNRDVRAFIELCHKHDLMAFPRIGPWFHAEARNGGYPEWFVKKMKSIGHKDIKYSKIDDFSRSIYTRWFNSLGEQFKGLYYKDGGPVFAIQLDNEQWADGPQSEGYEFLLSLRILAETAGIDVPFYTITGWPGKNLPEKEFIPLWGAYPSAPWTPDVKKLKPLDNYLFKSTRLDKQIGADLNLYEDKDITKPIYRHPYLTVEMGGGNQISYHRRPQLKGDDMLALVYTRLGVGANAIGYYIYHGAQNSLILNNTTPTHESKQSVYPYPNDYPIISYDFLAPISEWGFARPYYKDFKLIHMFINNYGENLASMYPTIPENAPEDPANSTALRYCIRSKNGSGYLFFNNYVRQLKMQNHKNVQFSIKNKSITTNIPNHGIDIKEGLYGIMPFNMYLGNNITLEYATAHPFSIIENKSKTYFFYAMDGIVPEFKFKDNNIKDITTSGKQGSDNGIITITNLTPGKNCSISITTKEDDEFKIVILTKEEALIAYEFKINNNEFLFLSEGYALYDDTEENLKLKSLGNNLINYWTYPELTSTDHKKEIDGLFTAYQIVMPKWNEPEITFEPLFDSEIKKQWLTEKTPLELPYGHIYKPNAKFASYKVSLPNKLPKGVSDVLVNFDYNGNTAQLYADNIIIADDFYSGLPMPFGLKRHQDKLEKQNFIFQITPLTSTKDIYFENVNFDFIKHESAILRHITVTPEYEVELNLNNE